MKSAPPIILITLLLIVWHLPGQSNLVISGFVDGSIGLPVEDGTDLGFSFDQLEVDLEKELAAGVSVRADIEFTEGTELMELEIISNRGDTSMVPYFVQVEQAYISFKLFKVKGVATPIITFGKFNAPIGYELLDAPDMWQFSHSLVFDNALPTNLSGISISQDLGVGLDLVAYIANGWDVNFADDSLMIFGGRLGFGGIEGLGLGVSGIQNDAQDLIIDLDGEVTMVPNLTVGFEFNTGTKDDAGKDINGWLVMANYAFSSFAITFRQDAWGDASSTTISPSKGLADGAGMLIEYRIDDDGAGTTTNSAAIEFTFTF